MFVRPNMLIAVSLPYSMLTKDQMKRILDVADKELVTPRGLRTLSPGNKLYKGIYSGNQEERDLAYHQGTVWPWLYGPFCEGWLRVYGNQGVQKIKKLIYGLEAVMSEHGVSTLSEIHDGDPPHRRFALGGRCRGRLRHHPRMRMRINRPGASSPFAGRHTPGR